MKKVILASASSRRRQLLKQAGLNFRIFPSTVREKAKKPSQAPENYALALAKAKAEDVAQKFCSGLIIAADTIVVIKGRIFGKPKNRAHAASMLKALSGKTQQVYTALALIDIASGKKILDIEKTTIAAKKLSPSQISRLSAVNHDKAGGYAVQKDADILVRKMTGDYYNVVGLPVKRLKQILRIFRVQIKDIS